MKVTTLACIQGSWIPNPLLKNVLDIGAGTGLLSLMVAQKYPCHIDAVEIEEGAFWQLTNNVGESPWAERIGCHHDNIMQFASRINKTYDFIISNPPFFANHLKSPDSRINKARHDASLTIETLMKLCASLLHDQGKISILLPPFETENLKKVSLQYSLHINKQLIICNTLGKPPKAIVSILSRQKQSIDIQRLIIREKNGQYSPQFNTLLNGYYLNL